MGTKSQTHITMIIADRWMFAGSAEHITDFGTLKTGRVKMADPNCSRCAIEAEARRDALEQAAQLVEKATYRKRWVKAAINGQANNVPPCELAAAIRKLKEDTQ